MAYKRTFNNRGGSNAGTSSSSSSNDEITIELDKKKQVTIRKFNNVNLVDIREFYIDKDSGERRPGKKGISLTEDSWYKLLESTNKIQSALDILNSGSAAGSPSKKAKTSAESKKPAEKEKKEKSNEGDDDDIELPKTRVKPQPKDNQEVESDVDAN
ncbi:transcriptional Coactivator p15-domain-containing protein [Scheffersomyces xylosifermentans]|uniref:transcriptional Coactivator p15-domain-containing protein n=1 Tax=Scheffersomyces xylosifermentans TaxID=1304137 RepID=UPI00315CDE68